MKKFVGILILGFLAVFCTASIASATPYSFGDNTIYWDGWQNGTGDDTWEPIGDPDFTGGVAEVTSGHLTTLTFYQSSKNTVRALSAGDLFLDTDPFTDGWNLVVDLTDWQVSGSGNTDPVAGNYNFYNVSLPLGHGSADGETMVNPGYILSGSDDDGGWDGWLIRDDHPVAASGITYGDTNPANGYIGQVYFSGWTDTLYNPYVFDFTVNNQPGILLDGPFTIGWTANCANDVLYETVNPVPEPATMLLLGTGLIGLAGIGRKKIRSSRLKAQG